MNNYSNPMVTYDEIVEALKAIIDCSKANGYLDNYGFLNVKYDSVKQNPIQKEQEQALLKALQSLEKTLEAANKVVRETLEQELAEITAVSMFTISANYEHSCEKRKLASQNDLVMKLKEMSLPLEILNKVEEIETVEELPVGFEEIIDEIEEFVDEEPIVEIVEEPISESMKVTIEDTIIEEDPEVEVETVELDLNDDDDFSVETDEKIESEEQFIEEEVIEDVNEVEDETTEVIEEEPIEDTVIEEENVEVEEEIIEEKEEPTPAPKIDASKIQLIKKALDKAREKGNEQLVKVLEQQLLKELENLK